MTDELNINEIAIGVANGIVDSGAKVFSSALSNQISKIKVHFKADFTRFVSASLQRTGYVKTIVHPDEPVPLSEIYVSLTFRTSKKESTDGDIINRVRKGGRVLILGTAGGGKSMLIRHLNITLLRDFRDLLPIYFELRILNSLKPEVLLTAIFDHVHSHIRSLSRELFEDGLRRGTFALVLDGFDEVDFDLRARYGAQIDALCAEFPKLAVAVTSRPEDNLPGLQGFTVYHANPMSKEQAIELLKKLDYDPEKKENFIEQIRSTLYNDHFEFLSNPLLSTIMLLTYSYHSDIPEKIHIFYQQAFETLYQRHDRSKGVYTRRSRTGLPIDEFEKTFSYFCASTYVAEKFSFDEASIRNYLSEAIEYNDLTVSVDELLSDLLESTCLLQRDGVDISFVHRSFQEYFTAKFIDGLDDVAASEILDTIIGRYSTDSVIGMLFDMNRSLIERSWVLPTVTKLIETAATSDGVDESKLIDVVFDELTFSRERVTMQNSSSFLGSAALAFWTLYEINEREGVAEGSKEGIDLVERVLRDPALSAIAAQFLTSSQSNRRDKIAPQLAIPVGDEMNWFANLNSMPKALFEKIDVRKYIRREYDGWVRIKADIESGLSSRSASLTLMLKRRGES